MSETNQNYTRVAFLRVTIDAAIGQDAHQHAYLFNNTRQACPIVIKVRAEDDNHNPIKIPDDLDHVYLIEYDGGEPLPTWSKGGHWWQGTATLGYDYDADYAQDVATLYFDANLALDRPQLLSLAAEKQSAYQSITNKRHTWDRPWFDAFLADLTAAREKGYDFLETPPAIAWQNVFAESRMLRTDSDAHREPAPDVDNVQVFRRYLFTDEKHGYTRKVAVAISRATPNASMPLATTNSLIEDPDGQGDGTGLFNSSVTMHAVKPPYLGLSAYGEKVPGDAHKLQDTIVEGQVGKGIRACEQRINANFNGRNLPLGWSSAGLGGNNYSVFRSYGETSNGTEWSITYRGQPGSGVVEYYEDLLGYLAVGWNQSRYNIQNLILYDYGHYIRYPSETHVVIGQVMGNDNWWFYDWDWNEMRGSYSTTPLTISDRYGNPHHLTLSITDELNYVSLFDGARLPLNMLPPPNLLTKANIKLSTRRVYANGRQQIAVEIYIEASEDGVFTALTPEELESIRLIDFTHPENVIPFAEGPAEDTPYMGWLAQRHHRHQYLGFPDPARGARVAARSDVGTYITMFLSAEPGARDLTLAFSIEGRDGATYRSNGTKLLDDALTQVPEIEVKDCVVSSEPALHYGAESYRLDGLIEGPPANFDTRLDLSIIDAYGAVVPLYQATCEPAGIVIWDKFSNARAVYTGYAGPGETTLHWNQDIPTSERPNPELGAPNDRTCTIMLCGRDDILKPGNAFPAELTVSIIDAYGNDQSCRLRLVYGEWGKLEIV
ncbi:hypothetical protein SAMN02800694_0304 [Luteibacter sp. UNCMF331Sha3.1]|uniref:hypothetical protein n=1 Tax=Luteibacter sp. UNCMF331Sha3.1 TaxID=1502760 RepID=UPI0008B3A2F3|nr:hypothetical protein [Luteibacter sp. UNCMF331Sha3.1]SEM23816.1 hypothetical protein SAMN02800694_0304 [Luteibacter sp. UNCMF331Sha3.1]